MIPINGKAPATASPVSEGRKAEQSPEHTPANTKSKPDLATLISTVAELLPIFVAEPWQPHKPLAIGIDKDLVGLGLLKPYEAGLVLRTYCRRRTYQLALSNSGPRYDLNSNVAGEVTPEQVYSAKLLLAQMDARTAEAAAKVRATQKAAWQAEKAKRAATAAADRPKGPRPIRDQSK